MTSPDFHARATHGVHAYGHVNTFSSAAMAYDVLGDAARPSQLR